MDFDLVVYIIAIVGSILISVVKALKKDENVRQVMKNRGRPVVADTVSGTEEVHSNTKKRSKVIESQPEPSNEYFSYETMSERDFEQAFSENVDENEHFTAAMETPKSNIHLTMDEEEVFKGVVWSEILNRKY